MTASNVIQFPPPLARAMLQASVHARGARGYRFHGRVDDWHAPGVVVNKMDTRCAVDAAWLVSHVMGAPAGAPGPFPGLPMVAERAREFAAMARGPKDELVREYQTDGAVFLAPRDYAILTDGMGIGKSVEAIIAAEARLSFGAIPSPTTPVVLIICPALAKRHWQREIYKWTRHEAEILDGRRPAAIPQARYVIVNYDILYGSRRADALGVMHEDKEVCGWGKTLMAQGFLLAIADEAHNLRGRSSQRGTAMRNLCAKIPVVWALTGTPMPNYVRDLWALLDIVTGGLAGKYWPWADAYCGSIQGAYGMDDKGASRTEELAQRLSFFMLGRTKESVGLELPPFQREVYKVDVEISAPTRYEGRKALDKANAVADAFRHTARAKRPAVVEQAIDALNARQKVVVFLYMREQCDAVGKAVRDKVDCTVLIVHGDMSPEGRDKMATTFREASAPCCFVATIDSVGVAISLVGADLVIFGDLLAEPWKLLQAEKRCHRFDSKNSVLVRYMIATGTIDEGHAETVIEKLAVLESTMGAQEENADLAVLLGKRSNEDIVDGLFARLQALGRGGGMDGV